jgi:hypothetical protein
MGAALGGCLAFLLGNATLSNSGELANVNGKCVFYRVPDAILV